MAVKTYPKGSKEKVSANFYAYEFDCPGKGCCTETPIDDNLVKYLQMIRDHFGANVTIPCGHRCETYNAKVKNAAKKSRHIYGQAADIHVEGVKPIEVARYAESIGVKGIGHYDTFVHIDTRTTKSFWYSHAQVYRSTFGGAEAKEESIVDYTLEDFIKDVQKACGAAVDGIAGPETIDKTVTISAHKNRKHAAVKAVQQRLYALGYIEVGAADGIAGPKFTAAIAHYQQDNHCWVDGEITAKNKTWRKLLGME
jgi:peptidoglycan hydrolase-like protein with peptidoglycan-binding domain